MLQNKKKKDTEPYLILAKEVKTLCRACRLGDIRCRGRQISRTLSREAQLDSWCAPSYTANVARCLNTNHHARVSLLRFLIYLLCAHLTLFSSSIFGIFLEGDAPVAVRIPAFAPMGKRM